MKTGGIKFEKQIQYRLTAKMYFDSLPIIAIDTKNVRCFFVIYDFFLISRIVEKEYQYHIERNYFGLDLKLII